MESGLPLEQKRGDPSGLTGYSGGGHNTKNKHNTHSVFHGGCYERLQTEVITKKKKGTKVVPSATSKKSTKKRVCFSGASTVQRGGGTGGQSTEGG